MISVNLNKEQKELARLAIGLRRKSYQKEQDANYKNLEKLETINIQLDTVKKVWKPKQIAILVGCIEEYAAHSKERLSTEIDVNEIIELIKDGLVAAKEEAAELIRFRKEKKEARQLARKESRRKSKSAEQSTSEEE